MVIVKKVSFVNANICLALAAIVRQYSRRAFAVGFGNEEIIARDRTVASDC